MNWPNCSEMETSRRSMTNRAEQVIEVEKLTKRYGELVAVIAAVVFVLDITATKWKESR
jgi:hypothetical protein